MIQFKFAAGCPRKINIAKMARFSFVLSFVLCVLAVKAFPNARRSGPDHAYVVYSRCVDAPESNVCGIGYKIRNFGGDKKFNDIAATFSKTKSAYDVLFPDPDAACPHLVMKLLCHNSFPECLPKGRLDYGDRDDLFRQIEEECVLSAYPMLGRYLVGNFSSNSFFKSGIQKDSDFAFNCIHVPQDPEQRCPKPEYAMPSKSAKEYYQQIEKLTRDMAKDKDSVPEECFKKAFNLLACQSYGFCSADGDSVLVKTTEEDCRGIAKCFAKHKAPMSDDVKQSLDKTCPMFPNPDKNEEVDLP